MKIKFFILLIALITIMSGMILFTGTVEIPLAETFSGNLSILQSQILFELRIPRVLTSFLAGGGLALCGLLLQTYFQNPMAGPFVLGIHSGASLAVGLFILSGFGVEGAETLFSSVTLVGTSFLGSLATMLLLLAVSLRIKSNVALLLVGLLLGYITGGLVNILINLSAPLEIQSFIQWGLGSFQKTNSFDLTLLLVVFSVVLIISQLLSKKMDVVLLGETYARSMGVSIRQLRFIILVIVSLLSGAITSFCGPIAFVGIMAPHLGRIFLRTENHSLLIPASVLIGGSIALISEYIVGSLTSNQIPLNSVLGIFGGPVLAYMVWVMGKRGQV